MLIEGVMLYLLIIEVYNTELRLRLCYLFSLGKYSWKVSRWPLPTLGIKENDSFPTLTHWKEQQQTPNFKGGWMLANQIDLQLKVLAKTDQSVSRSN